MTGFTAANYRPLAKILPKRFSEKLDYSGPLFVDM